MSDRRLRRRQNANTSKTAGMTPGFRLPGLLTEGTEPSNDCSLFRAGVRWIRVDEQSFR